MYNLTVVSIQLFGRRMNQIKIDRICATGVGIALAYLASKLLGSERVPERKGSENEEKMQEKANRKELHKLMELQQLLRHKAQQFEIQKQPELPEILSKKCILNFLWETLDLIDSEEIQQLISENRIARRAVFPDVKDKSQTYFRFVYTLDENIKYVLQKSQKDFAAFLGLNYRDFIESISYHSNAQSADSSVQFRVQVMEVMSSIRDSLHSHLPLYEHPVSSDKMLEIVDYQIQLLKQKKELILEIVKRLEIENREEEEALPILLSCYIDDCVYEKFNVEGQQLSISPEDMTVVLKEKTKSFKQIRDQLIEDLHYSVQDNIIIHSDFELDDSYA